MSHTTMNPWNVDFDFEDDSFYRITGEDERDDDISPIFTVALVNRNFGSESVSNARMMAAAPDMLELLYKCLPFIEDATEDPCYKPHVVKDLERTIKALLTLIDKG
jgi:hypothetical protein